MIVCLVSSKGSPRSKYYSVEIIMDGDKHEKL